MREIIFRGKRTDNNEWVYGDLFHTEKDFKKVVEIIDFNKKPYTHIIDSSTVGQFTGLTDKNGTKVFEGDKLSDEYCGSGDEAPLYYEIIFDEAKAKFIIMDVCCGHWIGEDGQDCYSDDICDICHEDECRYMSEVLDMEVIGNIHDNPEIL